MQHKQMNMWACVQVLCTGVCRSASQQPQHWHHHHQLPAPRHPVQFLASHVFCWWVGDRRGCIKYFWWYSNIFAGITYIFKSNITITNLILFLGAEQCKHVGVTTCYRLKEYCFVKVVFLLFRYWCFCCSSLLNHKQNFRIHLFFVPY